MAVYKESGTNTWRVIYRYTDWLGERKQTSKRGFPTKRDALAWEREQLQKAQADLDMTFGSFVKTYTEDMQSRMKENTWETKEHIIRSKLMPYFGKRKMSEIQPKEIIAWQNEMMNYRDANGKAYSPVYLKTLHNQLSAIFNHAVKYYGLTVNPAAKVGNMGKAKSREMLFWTKDEYLKFADAMMDKPMSFYAFETLYWCGIREGELLALTAADFDFEKGMVSITKSYQRLKGRDVVTDPKTPKSNRVIKMPQFLCDELQDFLKSLYSIESDDRVFAITKHYLHHEMDRGSKESGVKRIRIHDLRHSHVSLLGQGVAVMSSLLGGKFDFAVFLFVFGDKLYHKLYDLAVRRTPDIAADIAEFRQNVTVNTKSKVLLVAFVHSATLQNKAVMTLF